MRGATPRPQLFLKNTCIFYRVCYNKSVRKNLDKSNTSLRNLKGGGLVSSPGKLEMTHGTTDLRFFKKVLDTKGQKVYTITMKER